LRIAAALFLAASLVLPQTASSQAAPVKVDIHPLMTMLHHRNWFGVRDDTLAAAVQAAFSKAQFQSAPGPGADVLTLAAPDGVRKDKDDYIFTVVFSRDGDKLGEAVESCPIKKLTDCTDQLVLDARTAAQ
jgi:hypothetical protein